MLQFKIQSSICYFILINHQLNLIMSYSDKPAPQLDQMLLKTNEFKFMFEEEVGQGEFKQAGLDDVHPTQQISDDQQEEDQYEFQLDQGEQQTKQAGIKLASFMSHLHQPAKSNSQNYQKKTPPISIEDSLTSHYGFNSKYRSSIVFLDNGFVSMAAGATVVTMNIDKEMGYRVNIGHTNQVKTLHYDKQSQMLYSGSSKNQNRAQIIQWRVQFIKNTVYLEQIKKVHLPRKCQGVGALSIAHNYLVCIDQYCLHDNSTLYLYDLTNDLELVGSPIKLNSKAVDHSIEINQNISQTKVLTISTIDVHQIEGLSDSILQTKIKEQKYTCISTILDERDCYVCGTVDGCLVSSNSNRKLGPLHSGWVLRVMSFNDQKRKYLATCGGEDLFIRVFELNAEKWNALKESAGEFSQKHWKQALNYKDRIQIKMESYVTSIQQFKHSKDTMLLLGCRNGSIGIYNLQKRKMFLTIPVHFGYEALLDKYWNTFAPVYHSLTNCVLCPGSYRIKGQFSEIMLLNTETGSPLRIPIGFKSLCYCTYNNQLVTLLTPKSQNNQIYTILIQDINECITQKTSTKKQSPLQMSKSLDRQQWQKFIDNYQKDNEKTKYYSIEIDIERVGKPTVIRYCDGTILIGTQSGYLITYDCQQEKLTYSEDKHSGQVEEIDYQINSGYPHIGRLYKTTAQDQLYHWELVANENNQYSLKKSRRLSELKAAKWSHIAKYSWHSKYIWEKMTHYKEITNCDILDDKYTLVSMENGCLRIYNHPISNANSSIYAEFQLFDSPFRVLACSKGRICCFWKGIFTFFTISQNQ